MCATLAGQTSENFPHGPWTITRVNIEQVQRERILDGREPLDANRMVILNMACPKPRHFRRAEYLMRDRSPVQAAK